MWLIRKNGFLFQKITIMYEIMKAFFAKGASVNEYIF